MNERSKDDPPSIGADDLLLTREVALWLRAPDSTLRFWRHSGQGPRSFRLGRRVVYRRSDVEAWISERERASA